MKAEPEIVTRLKELSLQKDSLKSASDIASDMPNRTNLRREIDLEIARIDAETAILDWVIE